MVKTYICGLTNQSEQGKKKNNVGYKCSYMLRLMINNMKHANA